MTREEPVMENMGGKSPILPPRGRRAATESLEGFGWGMVLLRDILVALILHMLIIYPDSSQFISLPSLFQKRLYRCVTRADSNLRSFLFPQRPPLFIFCFFSQCQYLVYGGENIQRWTVSPCRYIGEWRHTLLTWWIPTCSWGSPQPEIEAENLLWD